MQNEFGVPGKNPICIMTMHAYNYPTPAYVAKATYKEDTHFPLYMLFTTAKLGPSLNAYEQVDG